MKNIRSFQQAMLTLATTTLALSKINVNALSSSFVPMTTRGGRRSLSCNSKITSTPPTRLSTTTTTSTTMFFGNLFQNFNTGFVESVIDYETLNHPGPELANAAIQDSMKPLTQSVKDPQLELATFAGGCFWGLELAYQRIPGVVYTTVGYTQGRETYPTYGQVSVEATGHTEAVCVYYNATECTYEELLDVFFTRVNPLTVNGQGRDYGKQYRTGVYYHTPMQENMARARFQQEQEQNYPGKPIATECKPSMAFWPAEKYHQKYLSRGGPRRVAQSAEKGCTDTIRCYG